MWRERGHLPWLRNVGEVRVWAGCGQGVGGVQAGGGRGGAEKGSPNTSSGDGWPLSPS